MLSPFWCKKAVSFVSLHFKFSLHFVPGLQSAFCTGRFASPLISQLGGSQILNYFASTGEVKVQRVLWFHSWVVLRFNERCTLESLTASVLSFPTFFRNQQAVVGNLLNTSRSILASLLHYCWIMKRKQRPWRNTWSISWRNKQMKTSSKQKHLEILTSLLYGKVNCASKPSHVESDLNSQALDKHKFDLFPFVTLMNDYQSK